MIGPSGTSLDSGTRALSRTDVRTPARPSDILPPMEFIFEEIQGDVLVVGVDGGLDASNSDEFLSKVDAIIDGGVRKLVLDCEKLRYISSYGLGVLIRLHKRLKSRGGDVKIAAVSGPVADVLRLTRLDRVFNLYPDVNRALLEFRADDGSDS